MKECSFRKTKIKVMKIELKRLVLTNFKGIRSFIAIINPDVTNIMGDNATGKTTLMDAFLWLFFGKDSTDRKDFEIKTLDENNQPYHRLDHEVTAVILVDHEEITIRRTFREKWVKKRGSNESEFAGHSTEFFWNDVPLKESEYQAKVAEIINENIFKLITNTSYFNSLNWKDRRNALLKIAGEISNVDVLNSINAGNDISFKPLVAALQAKKSVDDFKKEIGAKKKKIKDELEQIPSRIDEANRSLPEELNYASIEADIDVLTAHVVTIDKQLMDKTEAEKERQNGIISKMTEVNKMKSRLQQIEFEEKNKAQDKKRNRERLILDKKNELRNKLDEKQRKLVDYSTEEKRKSGLELIKDDLGKKWDQVNAEQLVFNDNQFECPSCHRPLEGDDIEAKKNELTANFNSDKARRLKDVTDRGVKTKQDIDVIIAKLSNIKDEGTALAAQIEILHIDIATLEQNNISLCANEEEEVKNAITANTEYAGLQEMIKLREEEIQTPAQAVDNSSLIADKKETALQLDNLKKQFANKDQRVRILKRIDELNEQEKNMSQELADLEGIEFSIEQFTKAKMDTLESRINGLFKKVRFKMFEEQINGGQVEACTTLIDGVPYPDANTASKIQAGLDIINAFSEYYNVFAPVWIDNRESVIRLPETRSQLINLFVSPVHKKLTVAESREQLVMA
jgi:exonuclease SbcC